MTTSREKTLLYINAALFIGLIAIVLMGRSTNVRLAAKLVIKKAPPIREALPKDEKMVYDITKVKPPEKKTSKVPPKDLKEMYENFSKDDVGDNMIEDWSKVKPEDKAKFMDVLDKKIESSKEALKKDPKDKRAKSMLFISESLKKLASNDFNYKIKD